MKKYTTEELCQLTGLSLATVKYLLARKRFRPTWPSTGKKVRNYYSQSDVKMLKKYRVAVPLVKYELLKKYQ